MHAFLKNISYLAFGPKGGGRTGKKSPKTPGLWNPVPAIINPSWVAKLDHCLKPTAVGDLCRLIYALTRDSRPGAQLCWPILWLYVGLYWRILAYLAGNVGSSCGYVGLCEPHIDPYGAKRSEKWEQQKNAVKRRIFWWPAAYLGAILAYLGAMLAYLEGNVGPSWGYLGPSWSYLGPSWGYAGPAWRRPKLWNPVPAIINPSWVAKLDHCLKPTAVGDLRRLI